MLLAGARLCCALAGAIGLAEGLLADELKVEKGHPETISSDVTYDTVDLHDNLTIDGKATLTLADNANKRSVFVATNAGDDVTLTLKDGGRLFQSAGKCGYLMIGGDGSPAGSGGFGRIRVEGRHDVAGNNDTFRMRYIVVDSGAAVPTDGGDNTVLYIGSNTLGRAQVWTKGVQNWNLSPIRVQFDGGYLCSTDGGGEYWFASSSGAKGTIVVESCNGHPIQFDNSGHNDKTLYNATGTIVFVGDGDLVATPGSNVAAGKTAFDYRTPITGTSDNYDWSAFHGNVFVGQGRLEVSGANVLPCHAGCGVIGSTAAKSFIDIKKDNAVNGFDCLGVVTNSSAAGTTVTVGLFKDAPLKAASIAPSVLVKQVGTHVMTLEAAFVGRYRLDGGTLSVKKDVTFGELSLAAGTSLMIDGCVARISPAGFSDAGATVTCINGGRLDFVAEDDCGVYLSTLPSEDFAKVGAGTLTVNQRAAFASGRLTVKEGTLRLAGLGLTNEWWRITIARAVGGWHPYLSCTGLFAEDGHVPVTEDGAYACISTEDASILQRGQTAFVEKPTEDVKGNIRYETPSGQAVAANPNTTYAKDVSALLGSAADRACCFSRFESPTAANNGWAGVSPQYPVVFSLRRATGDDVPVTGFSVRMPWNSNNAAHTNRYVSAWKVETSPDGVNWAVVQDHSTTAKEVSLGKYGTDPWGRWHGGNGVTEEVTDKTSPDFEKCLAPLPLDIPAGSPTPGAKGLAAAVGVQVCAGATLDCSLVAGGQELGDLTVDLAAGGGTLKGVKLAATGTLRIKNAPQDFRKSGYVVPLAFVDSTTTGDLSGWTVEIDGAPIVNGLCWEAGRLMIVKLGMLILFK